MGCGNATVAAYYRFIRFLFVIHAHVVLVGVVACRAYLGRFGAGILVAAHEAFPYDGFVAFPHSALLYLVEIVEEAVTMPFFDCRDGAEMFGNVGKAFFFGGVGEL